MSTIAGKDWYRNTFLQSDDWKLFRTQVLAEQDAKCFVCGTKNTSNDVHHIWYGEGSFCGLRQFVVLCRSCHEAVHDKFEPCGARNESEKKDAYGNFLVAKESIVGPTQIKKTPAEPKQKNQKKPKEPRCAVPIGTCRLCRTTNCVLTKIDLTRHIHSESSAFEVCAFCVNSLVIATKPHLYKTKSAFWTGELRDFIRLSRGRPDPNCIKELLDEKRALKFVDIPECFSI